MLIIKLTMIEYTIYLNYIYIYIELIENDDIYNQTET